MTMLLTLLKLFIYTIIIAMVRESVCDDEVYSWESELYPNLTDKKEAKFCTGNIRNPPSAVCDPDLILFKAEAQSLDELIANVPNNTKCLCDYCPPYSLGLNIKVALVKHIKTSPNVSIEKLVERFSDRTRRRWRYGYECHNDVLVFVAALDNQVFISMGSKAREVISSDLEQNILKETKAHFTTANYFQGLESIIASLQDELQDWKPEGKSKSMSVWIIIAICVAVVVIIIILLSGVWFCINRDKNSLSNSFEFIGSFGRHRKDHKQQTTTKSAPIYRPVKTVERIDERSSMKTSDPIV